MKPRLAKLPSILPGPQCALSAKTAARGLCPKPIRLTSSAFPSIGIGAQPLRSKHQAKIPALFHCSLRGYFCRQPRLLLL
jgi:hypothetical protein